jgi:glucose/arabinose dehydrogenase
LLAASVCRFATNCYLRPFEPWRLFTGRDVLGEAIGRSTGPTTLPPGAEQVAVARGLDLPTSFDPLPDGRILVSEKNGLIRLVDAGRVSPRPYLDLRGRVDTWSLRGIMAVRAAPDFSRSGEIYVFYVRAGAGPAKGARTMRLSRFTRSGDERVLLGTSAAVRCSFPADGTDCIPADQDHVGGWIEFDAEGAILLSTGDGWGGGKRDLRSLASQDLDSLAGKLLRVDPLGRGLPSNPFWTGDERANRSKVYAYGLRNPFRFTLDELGRPVVADVGWNDWDELDVVRPGDNLGWPCYEGLAPQPAYADERACRTLSAKGRRDVRWPVLVRPAASIIGGDFLSPREYVFGDWLDSSLYVVTPGGQATAWGPVRQLARPAAGPTQIRVQPDGSILYLALNAGELRRITLRP